MGFNPNDQTAQITLSNSNTIATSLGTSGGIYPAVRSFESFKSGYYYAEFYAEKVTILYSIGIMAGGYALSNYIGMAANSIGWFSSGAVYSNGTLIENIQPYTTGDVVELACDFNNQLIWFRTKATGLWNNDIITNQNPDPNNQKGGISLALTATSFFGQLIAVSMGTSGDVCEINVANQDTLPPGLQIPGILNNSYNKAFDFYPKFPTLPQGFPVKATPKLPTIIGNTKSLRELRLNQQTMSTWDFEILFEELQYISPVTYSLLLTFLDFYSRSYGKSVGFSFFVPWDNSRTNQLIGVGDGVTTSFYIWRTWGTAYPLTEIIGCLDQIFTVTVGGNVLNQSEYVIIGSNLIQFNTPPEGGQQVTMTFSFYYFCHFTEDNVNVEEFFYYRNTIKSLKFKSMINYVLSLGLSTTAPGT